MEPRGNTWFLWEFSFQLSTLIHSPKPPVRKYFDYPIMASIAAFQPYGLIRTPIQQQLYFRAHIANIHAGISNPKETETVALILNKNIFTEPHSSLTRNSHQHLHLTAAATSWSDT